MVEKPTFAVGDIVRLKSGGPDMTVSVPDTNGGKVLAQWFAGKKLEFGYFAPDSIEKAASSQTTL